MGFLFGFRKKPVIQDVVAKEPTPVQTVDDLQVPEQEPVSLFTAAIAQPESSATEPVEIDELDLTEAEPEPEPELVAEPAPEPRLAAEEAPQEVSAVEGQMDTLKATREDVIAAYKIFLGRLPESLAVVEPRVGVSPAALLVDFLASKEFLDQPAKSQLVLALAKKILEARQAVEANAGNGPAPGPTSPTSAQSS